MILFKYPVSQPDLTGNEAKYLQECIKTNFVSSQGQFVKDFEKKFAKAHQTDYGVACSSGTTALTLALRALGVGPGDEVIVPEFTMIATAWAVTYLGATPVFVDCQDNLNIDPTKIEEKITSRTKVILPVHIYGRRCDMKKINEIAYEYNLFVVEDSCEAHSIAPTGDIACYSLFANKIITAGEGGVCLTNSERLAKQMKHLRGMAFDLRHTFLHKKVGYNFRMTNLQAAVALAQIERLAEFLKKRKQIEGWYNEELRELDFQQVLLMPPRDVLWMYDLVVKPYDREPLMKFLEKNGIETRMFFKPMSQQPMYRGSFEKLNAYRFSQSGLYLPTYSSLTQQDVKEICNKIKEFFN